MIFKISRRLRTWAFVLAIAAGLGFVIYSGISARAAATAKLIDATAEAAVPVVNVIHPTTAAPTEEIILPGNSEAFIDSPIYARTNGYLKHWYFDIGAK